jgi:hypothetical protein
MALSQWGVAKFYGWRIILCVKEIEIILKRNAFMVFKQLGLSASQAVN